MLPTNTPTHANPKRFLLRLGLAVALLVGFVVWWRDREKPKPASTSVRPTAAAPAAPIAGAQPNPEFLRPEFPPPTEIAPLAEKLGAPTTDIRADLRLVADLLEAFRTNFPREGNPTGENAEIAAALAGKNSLRFGFIDPRHPAINARGELCDRWGTPFFFHAESGTQMKIRSAGPDKILWTADDVDAGP